MKKETCDLDYDVRVYPIRWFLLFLFILYAASSALQWVQYCIISDTITKYYGVSTLAVDWTSLITMVTYPPLLIPGSYVIDKMGLRVGALIGVIGTTVGTWIKVFSVRPDLFWVTFTGQTIVFISQIFILSLPPRLAAVWFPMHEISRACSLGAFGTQLGTAAGFILPRLIVKNHENVEDIGKELSCMFYSVAIFTTAVAVLVIIFFKSGPEHPPSIAQAQLKNESEEFTINEFYSSYKSLLTNKPFLMLMLAYGINIGAFAGICTVLNQLILAFFPGNQNDSGRIGLLMVVIGMVGSAVIGYILDKTRRFKETTFIVYVMVAAGVAWFMFALEARNMPMVYISAITMGFFQNAYYPVGFETAAELTFPQPESTSSGLLISSAQIFGVIFTLYMDQLFHAVGAFWAVASMVILLAFGCLLTALTPNVLLRQKAFTMRNNHKKLDVLLQQEVC